MSYYVGYLQLIADGGLYAKLYGHLQQVR